jgi:hypothetical protein
MWDDAEFSLSLSKGTQATKAVGLPLVEKVRVHRGCVLFTHREGVTPTFYKNKILFANIEVHIGCLSICRAYEKPSKINLA